MKACWIGTWKNQCNIVVIYKNMKLHFYQYWHFVQGWHFRFLSVGICSLRWVGTPSYGQFSVLTFPSLWNDLGNNNLLHSLCCCYLLTKNEEKINVFPKFYGKVDVISWLLFHHIWKNYVLYWDFDSKSWIMDFFHSFHSWKNTTKQLFLSKFQCRK